MIYHLFNSFSSYKYRLSVISLNMSFNKPKSGAEKLREKKQKLLFDSAKSSQNIRSLFFNKNIHGAKQGK